MLCCVKINIFFIKSLLRCTCVWVTFDISSQKSHVIQKTTGIKCMTKIVGILNITNNSFSDGGKYNVLENAIDHFNNMLAQGADLIDIGAQSTSYGANIMSHQEEWDALEPMLDYARKCNTMQKVSVDTFYHQNALKSIDIGVRIINDVKGCQCNKMLELIASKPNVKYINMFSICIPANHARRAANFQEIIDGMKDGILKMKEAGIKNNQIILDPGIGFATGPELSFEVLNRAGELNEFGYPVLIGASRKTFINSVANLKPQERDLETTLISCLLRNQNVEYLRVHNVDWHKRAFNLMERFEI